ncbi:MAG TPA: type II toxin-antitoxin system VapB family antitoxin [Thermoanaerobaculia bacterium]|jgi:Arc/MetJ family transcription regulator
MTRVAIDDQMLAKAQKIGGHRTRKATVNEALREYIQRRQTKILRLLRND